MENSCGKDSVFTVFNEFTQMAQSCQPKKKMQSLFSDFHNSREEVKEYFFLDKGSFKKVQGTFKNGKKAGRKRFEGEKALESVK